jgi:hypothetical protein
MLCRRICLVVSTLLLAGGVMGQDFGYATDTLNQIVEINLDNGVATPYTGMTAFGANALGFAPGIGSLGSVIYSNATVAGPLAIWDRANNTHTVLGSFASTTSGYTNPYTGGAIADAAYWSGGAGLSAGYYFVTSARQLYRVDLNSGATAISNVTLLTTIPGSGSFSFGDIAFDLSSGLLYLSSQTGFSTYNFSLNQFQTISSSIYEGQIAFGLDGHLYGVGAFSGSGQGNDFYSIDLTTGVKTLIAANTDPGATYRDFSGAATVGVVPEPAVGVVVIAGLIALGAVGAFGRRMRTRKMQPVLSSR